MPPIKTNLTRPVVGPAVQKWYSAIGRMGGLRRSKRKAEMARINGLMPCKEGKKRGRPKRKTGPIPLPTESISFDCANPECREPITLSGEPITILKRGREIAVKCVKCGVKTRVPPELLLGP